MAIYFYVPGQAFGALSNFSPHGIKAEGEWWPTVEHFFQSQKFEDEAYRERIRLARTPKAAKELGRTRSLPLRADWDEVKEDVMLSACRQKFAFHEDAREVLLSTGDEEIVENAPGDFFWGCGADGTGRNALGRILMQVRDELRGQA